MRKVATATMTALTLATGCSSEFDSVEKYSNNSSGIMIDREQVARNNPDLLNLATRYNPDILLTQWSQPKAIDFMDMKITLFEELGQDTAPGTAMIRSALHNTAQLLKLGASNGDATLQTDYSIGLDTQTNYVYMVYGNEAPLKKLVDHYRPGPVVNHSKTADGQSNETMTWMAPFEYSRYFLNSEFNNSKWVTQAFVCANMITVTPGPHIIAETQAKLAVDQDLEDVLQDKVDKIIGSLCESLALAHIVKDGEARSKIELSNYADGYANYERLLQILFENNEIPEFFLIPRLMYENIHP